MWACSDFYWPMVLIETAIVIGWCSLCLYRLRYVLEPKNWAVFISLVVVQITICINKIYSKFGKKDK